MHEAELVEGRRSRNCAAAHASEGPVGLDVGAEVGGIHLPAEEVHKLGSPAEVARNSTSLNR